VACRVVVVEQRPFLGQRARKVRIGGGVAERRGVVLVLEHDHEHVADRRELEAGGRRSRREQRDDQGGAGRGGGADGADDVAAATKDVRASD